MPFGLIPNFLVKLGVLDAFVVHSWLLHRDTLSKRRYTEIFEAFVIRIFVTCPVHVMSGFVGATLEFSFVFYYFYLIPNSLFDRLFLNNKKTNKLTTIALNTMTKVSSERPKVSKLALSNPLADKNATHTAKPLFKK